MYMRILATNKEDLSVSKESSVYTQIYIYKTNDGITMDNERHGCTKSHTLQ